MFFKKLSSLFLSKELRARREYNAKMAEYLEERAARRAARNREYVIMRLRGFSLIGAQGWVGPELRSWEEISEEEIQEALEAL